MTTSHLSARRRVAKGPKRRSYFDSRELDKVMMMMTATLAEISALRDRVDTHEALAAAGEIASPEAVEAFELDAPRRAAREARRAAILNRVFRPLLEEIEVARLALSPQELDRVLAQDQPA